MVKSSVLSLPLQAKSLPISSAKKVRLYNAQTIDQLSWQGNEEVKDFLLPIMQNGTKHYIDNIDAKINVLTIDSHIIPMVMVDEIYDNSFVCSPYAHYICYALESTEHIFKRKILAKVVNGFIKCLGTLLRKGKINKIIYVNNWLVPTDLYCKNLTQEHIEAITQYLANHFPDYAIAFKSLNHGTHSDLLDAVQQLSYHCIVTRQIFLTDTSKEEIFKTRIFKSDIKLLNECNYTVLDKQELTQEDLIKILSLYKKLYLEKYSKLNPQHNQNFMNLVQKSDFFHIKAIKKNQGIEGFFGYFIRDGIMTAPLFGHLEKTEDNKSLYRVLSTLLTLEAKAKGCLLHQSAGASFYKTVRRAEPHLEYMAVYSKHLSFARKIPWRCLSFVMNKASRFFKEY